MIVLISDTHENLPAIEKAVSMIQQLQPEIVIHCGDIISPPVLRYFGGLPMRLIFGNNDGERRGLARVAEELGFGEVADELELEISTKRCVAYHGTDPLRLEALISSEQFDYVFTGHTHEAGHAQVGTTTVINPGALFLCERYTFVTLQPEDGTIEYIEVPREY